MLSFVVVVRVRVKVVRFFSFFGSFSCLFWQRKTKNTTDCFLLLLAFICEDDGETKAKTTLMVFERENEREMGETLSARALKSVAAFLRAAR